MSFLEPDEGHAKTDDVGADAVNCAGEKGEKMWRGEVGPAAAENWLKLPAGQSITLAGDCPGEVLCHEGLQKTNRTFQKDRKNASCPDSCDISSHQHLSEILFLIPLCQPPPPSHHSTGRAEQKLELGCQERQEKRAPCSACPTAGFQVTTTQAGSQFQVRMKSGALV